MTIMLKFAKTALFIAVLASSVAAQAAQDKTGTIPCGQRRKM